MKTRYRHLWFALRLLPSLLVHPAQRRLLYEMRLFCQGLPVQLRQPLPKALAQLASVVPPTQSSIGEKRTRELADLTALLERRSPLGLCLRRSLTRYYFLRRINVPLMIQFGAKFVGTQADRDVTGHAWVMVNGRPYHEIESDWRGFTVMFIWPQEGA